MISTKEGDNYGLRHLENIWKKTELAWSTGFVTTSHGNTLNSKDYEKITVVSQGKVKVGQEILDLEGASETEAASSNPQMA